ncbi:MAG: glutathione synthase [Myxococcota bacterium]|nr:glutathione synthase [Myxococcota bacterium]
MSHRFVFIMDPIQRIDIQGDSSFALMLEAQSRGGEVWYGLMKDLELLGNVPYANLTRIRVQQVEGDHFEVIGKERICLDDVTAIFMRKDPPIDAEYFASTFILDFVSQDKVVMVNDPRSLRDCNEKIFAMRWPELMPPTMVARSIDRIKAFIQEHQDVVVKPLNTSGGAGVVRLSHGDKNTGSILEMLTQLETNAIVAQAFLSKVTDGDRRVLLIGGEPIGVINRRPSDDDLRSNMHVGGVAEAAGLTPRDLEICQALRSELVRLNLPFVGIDIIDGHLTEINVTSPTGFQELKRLSNIDGAALLLDWIENRQHSSKSE